jgi:hypothetical protein
MSEHVIDFDSFPANYFYFYMQCTSIMFYHLALTYLVFSCLGLATSYSHASHPMSIQVDAYPETIFCSKIVCLPY